MDDLAQVIPIDAIFLHEGTEIYRAEVTHVIREQGLLATRVRGLILPEMWHGIVVIGLVYEEHPWLARLPCPMDDPLPHTARGKLPGDLFCFRMDQIVGGVRFDRCHECV